MFNFINKQNKAAEPQPAIHDLVGCCGKMPLHADFIKHNIKIREAVALDEWVQDGVTLLNRRYEEKWKRVFELSPNFRFAFIGDEENKTVTGVISPSADKIGRSYPFIVFRATDNSSMRKQQSLVPLAFAKTYDTIDQMLKLPWKDKSLDLLLNTINDTQAFHHNLNEVDWSERLVMYLEGYSIGQIWEDILPGADEKVRAAFMYVVISSLQTVARRSPQRVHWGLRLPLPSGEKAIQHIVFWLQLSNSVLRGRKWRASFIWNPAVPGIPSRLLLFFHQIPASYFSMLLEPRRHDDTIMDVLSEMETINADPLQMSKYHFPADMSLQEVMDEFENAGEMA